MSASSKYDLKDGGHKEKKQVTEEQYGCFGCTARPLQYMNNVKAYVFWLCVFNFWEGFMVNGVINVVLVALETRYSISSTKSGLIASANDFGAFVFLLLVGYFGEKRHKPRVMTFGIFLMAVGSLVFSLPHFVGGTYRVSSPGDSANKSLCVIDKDDSECDQSEENPDSRFYPLLLVGQILLGIGAAPLFTIGLTYIDENTDVKMTSLYTGMTTCSAAVGVAIGYVVGGQSLSLFVDIDSGITGEPLDPDAPQWVGAWWLGSIIACVMFVLVALPILGFPRRLPGYEELLKIRKSEAHSDGSENLAAKPDFGNTVRDFPKAMYLLLKNPTFLCVCLGGTCDALIVGGTATFGAKLLQQLHNVDLTTAGWIMGAITVPGSGGGMLLGGYLVKRLQLRCRGILRLCAIFSALSLLFAPSWLARCSPVNMAGINSPYDPSGARDAASNSSKLAASCNADCHCSTGSLDPICTDTGLVYFSPCHAGCLSYNSTTETYTDCLCFDFLRTNSSDGLSAASGATITARTGDCTEACVWLYVFCVLFFFIMLCTFGTISPNITAVFRCVPYSQRSLAIGFELLFIRLLGTTPGPILFGFVIDSSCIVWEDNCGEEGTCWLYESSEMGLRILYWWIALKVLGIIFYILASIVYKPPPATDKAGDTIQSDFDVREATVISPHELPDIDGGLKGNNNDNSSEISTNSVYRDKRDKELPMENGTSSEIFTVVLPHEQLNGEIDLSNGLHNGSVQITHL